jgi:YD repeat-containing protein
VRALASDTRPSGQSGRNRRSSARLAALLSALAAVVGILGMAPGAHAAVTCPNANPVVNENQCKTGTSSWQVNNYSPDLGGFPTKTSVNLGENVVLKIGRNAPTFPSMSATVDVYRMGWYNGLGGRLVYTANNVTINNDFTCLPMDATTGKVDCGNWSPTTTIPGSALPASGVYLAKVTAFNGQQTHVVFTVRDDGRASRLLYMLPMSTYQAYNVFGGKSLYYGVSGPDSVSGTSRAVKVSFNRPLDRAGNEHDWFFGPDFNLLQWIERQGYDVAYTDDVRVAQDPTSIRQHNTFVISGHSEYWTRELFNAVKSARDLGVNIASFSANTAYWKVRLEDNGQTLVCYKTVEGGGSTGSGQISANDWGPDGLQGTADDALGADGVAGTADDHPENATTTFRDNGAPPGDPTAPPAGRVGPDMPENQLFGEMYVGDNDARTFPVTVPPANASDEFAGDRFWRNTGISTNTTTNIGDYVNWEWDTIPTQSQYTSRQPSGVKRLTSTNVQTASDNSWIQDEGRARATTPPPGQPGTVGAVKYTASSGALVFATGTMHWSFGLTEDADSRIQQATYNILSDMGAQPATPDGITVDPGGTNKAPSASFTISANPTKSHTTVTFNGSGSSDTDGTIVKYQWDLDGDGTFETDSGTNPTVTHSYLSEGSYDVRLRVTDNGGATDLEVKTLTVLDNQPPIASFTANPNPVIVGQTLSLNGSGSSDPDGSITKYEWDLDGNGTYETNTGATATTTTSFSTSGTVNVGLRVTDNGGKTATSTVQVTVSRGGVSNYGDEVLNTPGLVDYWRMGESSGTTLADSAGTNNATTIGGVTLGVPGGPAGDPNTAASFDGSNDAASANVNLAGSSKITVEFWLNWTTFANDDRLAMEFTPNYHDNDGGFLIDPDAFQNGGSFAVGIGRNASRNTAFFTRPSAGVWHHYAFVLDTTAPAATQITPYVDGQPVSYTKLDNGTGAGNFANSVLYMMSRANNSLFGLGALDEVAIYNRALTAAEIDEHFASYGSNRRPVAAFTATPNPVQPNATVTFNGSSSHDPDGSIVKYEWDLDGNGSYETNTGSTPTVTKTYATEGSVTVGLRVTDNQTGIDTETKTVNVVANQAPNASLTGTPNPAVLGQTTKLDASGSSDPDGSITKYEWDLDGNGTFETDTGTTATVNRQYTAIGTTNVTVRVTDNGGKTATSTLPVTVNSGGVSNYGDTVLDTAGLVNYWRMGEVAGPTMADSTGTFAATAFNGPTFGVPGAIKDDPNTAVRFDGSNDYASANVNLSSTPKATVEFWLKWNAYGNDDKLAMEFTPNFNDNQGGFLVDPNAPQNGGQFGVAIGNQVTRNNAFFARPSAGAWHHYAFVFDTTAPAASQITPYVDGQPVAYTKLDSGTGSGNFLNSTLYLMSRAGTALFGAGDLDDVAVYSRALSAATINEHYGSYGTNKRPVASFTATPNPVQPGNTVTFNASASHDPDGSIVKYEWDLDGNGSYETDTGTTATATKSYSSAGNVAVGLRVYDDRNGTDTDTETVNVGNDPPVAAFTQSANPSIAGRQVTFDASGSHDTEGPIAKYEWDLDGNGTFETDTGTTPTASHTYSANGTTTVSLRVTDNGGATDTVAHDHTVVDSSQPPTASFTETPNPVTAGGTVSFNASASNDPDGPIAKYEWDLDGNGSYETDTGTTATVTHTYASAGTVTVRLRVTDGDGMTGTTSDSVYVNGTGATYSQKVLATAGLADYWRMDDGSGTTLADAKGSSPATIVNGPTLGAAGALGTETPNSAVSFDGVNDYATAALDLSSAKTITLEFWLKWDAFANDEALAMEFTPDFNNNQGGFLVDPNSPQDGGRFGLGIGVDASRNNAFFARPTAATWHHYALVFDTTAPAATQIKPYVDGQAVAYTKTASGTGASFANATLYFMSRAGAALFGAGDLDELAVYTRALTSSEVTSHFQAGQNNAPTASFTATPSTANPGQTVSFNASASADSDGSITKYEWDLDGNGSYETDTGTTATASRSYTAAGNVTVGLRVTDNGGATATTTRTVTVRQGPTAAFTLSPNPANPGQTVTYNGSTSTAAGGATIAKYEWDLDGNGSYETDTGTTATATRSYTASGNVTVGLRVTDSNGATDTTSHTLTVNAAPTAAFTMSPSPALTRQTVTFNGSTSSDSAGPIAKYEWDLDGNGSFETNTGTTATATKVYDTEAPVTVGLRVTDGGGLTGTTTHALTVQSAYAQAVRTTTGLRAYWRFGETSGTSANDETTNNLDATFQNTPTLGATGLLTGDTNKATDFVRSSSGRATVADNTLLDPTNITLEAWVRVDSTPAFGSSYTILSKTNSSGNDFGYSLAYQRQGFNTQLEFAVSTGTTTTYSVNQTLTVGTTYYVVATYDGTRMRLYLNGTQLGTGQAKTGNIRNSAQAAWIGSFNTSDNWDGVIDEPAIYSTALSQTTITAHYNAGH